MVDIVVVRGEGTSPGDDIQDVLLATVEAALSRGRAELDEGALADAPELEIKLRDVRLGEIIEVDDSALGMWRGKVTGVSHRISIDVDGNMSTSTTINLRKPR
jgi:hypothetical protein